MSDDTQSELKQLLQDADPRLLSALHHELRGPLGTVLAHADFAQELLDGDAIDRIALAQILADIRSNSDQLVNFLDLLRAYMDDTQPRRPNHPGF